NPLLIEEGIFSPFEEFPQPTVLIGEHAPDGALPRNADYVRIDNVRASADPTAHLLSAGRGRLASGGALPHGPVPHPHGSAALRVEGFSQAPARLGIDPGPVPAPEVANWHRTDGRRAAHVLSAEHPEV